MELNYHSLPVLSRDIIARNDRNGMLLFQVYTDEIYFVPFAVYNNFIVKCNGSQTLEEIVAKLDEEFRTEQGKEQLKKFIQQLLNKQILQLW